MHYFGEISAQKKPPRRVVKSGAADEARTRYLHLGKVTLYQMSYGRTCFNRFKRRLLL